MAAEPPILYLKDIFLTFGGTPLLEGADISVSRRDRICLVGRNGSGKSTLLKIAAGKVEADKGEVFLQPGVTVRYLQQEPDLSGYDNVLDYAQGSLTSGNDPYRAIYLLNELGLTGEEKPENLSGGEMRRAALARVLAPEPDILLLDEPTNHLDLPAIEWLEKELRQTRSALVLISHDRRFLESLSNQTVWMDRGKSRHLNEGFAAFEDWRDKTLEEEELNSHKLDRKIHREEHWIVHGVSGRRKRNIRRVKELAGLKQDRAGEIKVTGGVTITQAESESSGKLVAKLENVSKSYGDRPIITDLTTTIMRGDRIGIVGPNGAGKTTLVNLITGKLEKDSGKIRLGLNLDVLTIDQKREMLNPKWSLKDALTDGSGDMVAIGDQLKHVMSYMKDFLFTPEQARTPIHALSGGERGRLMLARGLRQPSNFMILDEPTNDLDLETLDLLQEFLADYQGTVLLVSHDRDFIDRVCTNVIASDGDGNWTPYAGGYSDMVSQKGSGVQKRKTELDAEHNVSNSGKKKSGKSTPATKVKAKLSFKHKHALETLPKVMEKLESEIKKLKVALEAPDLYSKEPKKFKKYMSALTEREVLLVKKEEEWLELEMLKEETEG
ncbi:MAG: elongation factor 3 [Hyphomicrobiales bacterium]|nr:ATP-binding cassette domain-containing protein [Hyphomicrobiales bacterium]PCH51741.1 MAG: elongation factor 3 [Hyphomicrobiales bacterium]